MDLYGSDPNGLIWVGGHADGFRGRTFTEPDAAARYAIELDARGQAGVYHRSTTLARVPAGRGEAADSAAAYYFALDVDVLGPGHKATELPEGKKDLHRLIEKAGFPLPTAVIASGGGYYPQWRFTEPIDVRDPERLEWVTESFAMMSAHFIEVAKGLGWKLDNVRDLARVFRMPGTTNRKTDVHTSCLPDGGWGELYDMGLLASLARPDRGVVRARESAPTAASRSSTPVDEAVDAFDTPGRQFTRAQATEFIAAERRKLAATTSGFNNAINAFAMACAHFPWLVDRDLCARLVIRSLGESQGWTAPDADDIATINSAYSATEAGKSWVATEVEGSVAAGDGQVRPDVLPPPSRPLDVARELLTWIPRTDGHAHQAWWRDDFYRWTGAHWAVQEESEVQGWLYRQTGDAVYLAPGKGDGGPQRTPWAPTRKKIGDVAHALGVGVLQRAGEEDRVLAAVNGVIVGRELVPHSPARFNLFSLPFDYDPAATAPAWQVFLDQVLPDDRQAQEFLAEWFGYVLSGRTDQQKMAALIGKKRSGKGTIARVLAALVGKDNVAGLNLGTLGGTFGLEPFIGSALAVASDVRWHSRNIGDAVQVLLEISGEDHVTVHRKNRAAWRGRLGVRFMLMSNDTPTFSDRSGALVDRMIYLSFRQSFFGREDVSLTEKLMGELPGILNWALDGLDRLDGRGRFTQPDSGMAEAEATRRLADPIGSFIEDWCEVGPDREITLDHLFLKYRNWCESEGRTKDSTTKEIFSRDLRQKVEGLTVDRIRVEGKRTRVLRGITSSMI